MTMMTYSPEPFTDFAERREAEAFLQALAQVKQGLGGDIPLVIGGKRLMTEQRIVSINPKE